MIWRFAGTVHDPQYAYNCSMVQGNNTTHDTSKPGLAAVSVAAMGVVYGDIGTSPLYAFRLCFNENTPPNLASILGVLSLIFWSLAGLITLKYVLSLIHI